MGFRGKSVALAIAAAAVFSATATVPAQPANAATMPYKGTVSCGYKKVVGIWVDQPGNSGWAQYEQRWGNWIDVNWYYNLNSSSYRLHVGCGGTQQAWQYNLKTLWVPGTSPYEDFVCSPANWYCALS